MRIALDTNVLAYAEGTHGALISDSESGANGLVTVTPREILREKQAALGVRRSGQHDRVPDRQAAPGPNPARAM